MKSLLLAAGMIVAFAPTAIAQNRDSDGDVLSTIEHAYTYRDSDGEVISVLPTKYYYRDSDGNVISVLYYQAFEYASEDGSGVAVLENGVEVKVPTSTNANGDVVLPAEISVDGLIYKVVAAEDEVYLQTASRVNPTVFGLD